MTEKGKGKGRQEKKLEMFYTNTDGFLNKRDELQLMIQNVKAPHIIVLTELILKGHCNPVCLSDVKLDGYHAPFVNFELDVMNPGAGKRGIAVYVTENISYVEQVDVKFILTETVCVTIKLDGAQKLLILGMYQSPSIKGSESTAEICAILQDVAETPHSLLLLGDFNYPEIDWSSNMSKAGVAHHSNKFIHATQENLLTQHVEESTRFRHGQTPSLLDLILSNEAGLVEDLKYLAPIGLSDHALLAFSVKCFPTGYQHAPHQCRRNYRKGNYEKGRMLLHQTDWSTMGVETVENSWMFLKKKLEEVCEEIIPKQHVKQRRNIYMSKEALKLK